MRVPNPTAIRRSSEATTKLRYALEASLRTAADTDRPEHKPDCKGAIGRKPCIRPVQQTRDDAADAGNTAIEQQKQRTGGPDQRTPGQGVEILGWDTLHLLTPLARLRKDYAGPPNRVLMYLNAIHMALLYPFTAPAVSPLTR